MSTERGLVVKKFAVKGLVFKAFGAVALYAKSQLWKGKPNGLLYSDKEPSAISVILR